jgi:hypothetical protein
LITLPGSFDRVRRCCAAAQRPDRLLIAMSTLISEEYRKMQEELHRNPNYGVASVQYAPVVADILKQTGAPELLDYGAGKGRLGETLKTLMPNPPKVRHYDPARPEWAATPEPAPFVSCIDVLEHIEPELLDNVLDDLQRVTHGVGFFTVHTGPAVKLLADGRNAHLIQQPPRLVAAEIPQPFRPGGVPAHAAGLLGRGRSAARLISARV